MHPAPAADAVEYFPDGHAVHRTAPDSLRVFVTDPASHTRHSASVGLLAYRPGEQASQRRAPAEEPVSVIEPAGQPAQ